MKELLRPNARRFDELFDGFEENAHATPAKVIEVGNGRWGVESFAIGRGISFRSRDAYWYGSVLPKEDLVEDLLKSMLNIGRDMTRFEVVVREASDLSLVICNYGTIIGSRWIAFVETDSIPKGKDDE